MQENISERNGFIRLALGTGLTAFGIAHLTKESGSKTLGSALVIAGAMKVAEGAFLYCPTKALINSNVREAVYTSFDEYMDGDSLIRAYNDAYHTRWGNTPVDKNSRYSWSEGGIAKAASEAMDAISRGEDFSNVVQSFNNGQTSQSGSQVSAKSNNSNKNNSNNHYNKSKSTTSGRSSINPS